DAVCDVAELARGIDGPQWLRLVNSPMDVIRSGGRAKDIEALLSGGPTSGGGLLAQFDRVRAGGLSAKDSRDWTQLCRSRGGRGCGFAEGAFAFQQVAERAERAQRADRVAIDQRASRF